MAVAADCKHVIENGYGSCKQVMENDGGADCKHVMENGCGSLL